MALKYFRSIQALKPALAKVAQEVYDEWEQDENGVNWELGTGGICDRIADAFCGVLAMNYERAATFVYGDGHAYAYVKRGAHTYCIDLPAHVYEYGGGYSWTKIPDVTIEPGDIYISRA